MFKSSRFNGTLVLINIKIMIQFTTQEITI